jgi:diguanylate cyclase (GGDEF)-like protein/PAS domain S-box-containing protein
MFLVVGIGYAVFGVMLALAQRREPPGERSACLAAGLLMVGLGTILQSQGNHLPSWLAVWIGNTMASFGLLLQAWGVRATTRRPTSLRTKSVGAGVLAGAIVIATLLEPPWQVVWGSLAYAALFAAPTWTLLRWRDAESDALRLPVAAAFGAVAAVFAVRAVRIAVEPDESGVFTQGDAFAVAYLVLYLAMLTTGFGVLLLSKAHAEATVRRRNEELSSILESLPAAMFIVRDGTLVHANPAAERMFGYPPSGLVGVALSAILGNGEGVSTTATEVVATRRGGELFWVALSSTRLTDDPSDDDAVFSMTEITDMKNRQQELERRATTDDLTGLVNRRAFVGRGASEVSATHQTGNPLSVAIVDVDGLKDVNDSLGHAAGDQVLRTVAEACLQATAGWGLSARLGGDEFALILPGCDRVEGLRVAEQIRTSLSSRPVTADGTRFPVTISVGVAQLRDDELFEDLVERADDGMYTIKRAGRDGVSAG